MNRHADKTNGNKSGAVSNLNSNVSESALQFVDNRPEAIAQRKLLSLVDHSRIEKPTAQMLATVNDFLGAKNQNAGIAHGIVQRSIKHVEQFGCETEEAVGKNFETHMANRVEDPIEFSANRGAVPNSIIHITDQQLAEEVAAELYTWPDEWEPHDQIWITTNGSYSIDEYYDGELVESYKSKFKFKCQLKEREDGSTYYEVYHFGGPA